jgi:ABC-type uncharacterized transport system substrate-binding protein
MPCAELRGGEATEVFQLCRWCRRVAARSACAAGRTDTTRWRAHGHQCGRRGSASPHCSVRARSPTIGLEHRKKHPGRLPLGRLADTLRKYAAELVALAPNVILAQSSPSIAALLQATRTVPIVFTLVADPVGAGYVDSLAHPGGNATGFTVFEYSIAAKWLELLKEIAPRVTRVAVLRELAVAAGPAQFSAAQTVAPSLGMELRPVDTRDAGEIERAITAFAQGSNGGLLVTGASSASLHRNLIIALAARYRLPAVYFERLFVAAGGLVSYGSDYVDQFRRAAGYVDRILKGEKPGDLPVTDIADLIRSPRWRALATGAGQ